jgi:hypothetical protein
MSERIKQSEYMYWAKMNSGAKYSLASSDLMHFPLADLGISIGDLEITGASKYGLPSLREKIAEHCGANDKNVVYTMGTAMANHVAMASIIEPDDEVLIEHPVYELLLSTAQYLGANITRFRRTFENDFQIDTDELSSLVSAKTKLIILTNLHNPSNAFTDEETLKKVGAIAGKVGAKVLVDEVYLEAAFPKHPRSAFLLGDEFVTTASLTKVYGLSGLRCGWVLAEEKLAESMWRLIDLFYATPVHASELMSIHVFKKMDFIRERSMKIISANNEVIQDFFSTCDKFVPPKDCYGLVTFPKLLSGVTDDFCVQLRNNFETSVVPGRFFEMPEHIRIGLGIKSEMLKQGLANINMTLSTLKK